MPHDGGNRWYALHVKTTAERVVVNSLTVLNIETLLPVCRSLLSDNIRPRCCEKPLFPGYVFCNTDLACGPKLYHVPGLIGVVKNGKLPAPIAQSEIDAIRLMIDSGSHMAPHPFLRRGDEVLVTKGPLRGLKGVYLETDAANYLIVSFPLLQRSISIRVHSDWIELPTIRHHLHCA
jgi:transcription antitermination factor NusG